MSRRHKRPIEPSPSQLLVDFAEEIANAGGLIVDVPCGYGRNAAYLSSFGVCVTCIDSDPVALETIRAGRDLSRSAYRADLLVPMHLDLVTDPWPFGEETLASIINVHYYTPHLLERLIHSLSIGGYLLLETIDGRGMNYLELPRLGSIRATIADAFELRHYKEKPQANGTSSLKLLAIKRRPLDLL